jgi:hypothetical protein
LLYLLGRTGLAFHDVITPAGPIALMSTSGAILHILGQDISLTAIRRYEDSTGFGSPNGAMLLLGETLR